MEAKKQRKKSRERFEVCLDDGKKKHKVRKRERERWRALDLNVECVGEYVYTFCIVHGFVKSICCLK